MQTNTNTNDTLEILLDGETEPRTFTTYEAGVVAYENLPSAGVFEADHDDLPGPRQVSAFKKAANKLLGMTSENRSIEGVVGESARFASCFLITGKRCWTAPHLAWARVFEEFEGKISRSNANALTKAVEGARAGLDTTTIPVRDDRQTREEVDAQAEKTANYQREAQERDAARKATQESNRAELMAHVPPGALHAIVAELVQDESDSMSDYWGSKRVKTVVIGWSFTERENFKKLRQAAAGFEPTAHLAPGIEPTTISKRLDQEFVWWSASSDGQGEGHWTPSRFHVMEFDNRDLAETALRAAGEDPSDPKIHFHSTSLEHRDNYSMGRGNWVGVGSQHCSGWKVCRASFSRLETADGLEFAECSKSRETASGEPVEGVGYTIQDAQNKRGAFHLVVMDETVEREEFLTLRESAKSVGGWYSKAWRATKQPGGFGFDSFEDAEAWASATFGGAQ